MTEYGREARITFDCAEYLGFDQTEAVADATLEPSERGAEGLRIQVGTQLGSRSTPTRKPWCACSNDPPLTRKDRGCDRTGAKHPE